MRVASKNREVLQKNFRPQFSDFSLDIESAIFHLYQNTADSMARLNLENINRKTLFRATSTPAILLPCAGGSKMAYFGVKIRSQQQGYWNQSGNSLTPHIKSLFIGKHCSAHSTHLLIVYLCAQREGKKQLISGEGHPGNLASSRKPFFYFCCVYKKRQHSLLIPLVSDS